MARKGGHSVIHSDCVLQRVFMTRTKTSNPREGKFDNAAYLVETDPFFSIYHSIIRFQQQKLLVTLWQSNHAKENHSCLFYFR